MLLVRRLSAPRRFVGCCRSVSSMVKSPSASRDASDRPPVYVRLKPGEEALTVSLELAGRARNLNRPLDEPLEKALGRLRAGLASAKGDKRAKKQRAAAAKAASGSSGATGGGTPEEPPLLIELYSDAAGVQPIPPSTLNGCAWPTAVLLRVGAQDYDVVLNPPTVEVISLPSCPLAGYPLWPSVALAFASPGDCLWRWLRRRPGASGSSGSSSGSSSSSGVSAWEDAGCSSRTYTPSPADEGWLLRVECTPRRMVAACDNSIREEAGETVFADCGPVAPSPLAPAAVVRAPPGGLAPLEAPWQARVLSYNILAEQYAGTAYAQDVLFNYCPRAQLASAYRRQLVLQELRAYCPDVAALQEVDATVFNDYLEPHLSDGMPPLAGRYSNKAGRVREGAATFWRTDKWAAVAARDIGLRGVFARPLAPRHAQFEPLLDASPALEEALQKVSTIAQLTLLLPRAALPAAAQHDGSTSSCSGGGGDGGGSSSPGTPPLGRCSPLLIINTHLFFHPYAPHIRTMHVAAILAEAAAALNDWATGATGCSSDAGADAGAGPWLEPGLLHVLRQMPPPTVLLCGDLNSDLNTGVPGAIELLRSGHVAADHWDWAAGAGFRWGKGEEEYATEDEAALTLAQTQTQAAVPAAAAAAALQSAGPAGSSSRDEAQQPGAGGGCSDGAPPAGAALSSPYVLASADGLASPYTNYTSGYKALLDYVWYQPERVGVSSCLPIPTPDQLGGFIPNTRWPSDHLAVVYDLEVKPWPQ